MAYSDFSLPDVLKTFALSLEEQTDLFGSVPEAPISNALRQLLDETVPYALATNTEKGRSELIVAPLLLELRRLRKREITFFSGVDFNVDPDKGLRGTCDFLITRSPEMLFVRAPVVTIVEAKNESIKGGLGQCVAEMVAARRFNEKEGTGITTVYGAVTTGSSWKFMQLDGTTVSIDLPEYHINTVGKILGILCHMTR